MPKIKKYLPSFDTLFAIGCVAGSLGIATMFMVILYYGSPTLSTPTTTSSPKLKPSLSIPSN